MDPLFIKATHTINPWVLQSSRPSIPRLLVFASLYFLSCNMLSEPSKLPENLDHLVYTASSLDVGMDEIERILGVRPVPGGRHPGFGTHNALLSLGPSTYLEIIAPDPETLVANDKILLQKYFEQTPRLSRWVIRTEQIEELSSRVAQDGLSLGEVQSGSRAKPDGSVLTWRLTDPRYCSIGWSCAISNKLG